MDGHQDTERRIPKRRSPTTMSKSAHDQKGRQPRFSFWSWPMAIFGNTVGLFFGTINFFLIGIQKMIFSYTVQILAYIYYPFWMASQRFKSFSDPEGTAESLGPRSAEARPPPSVPEHSISIPDKWTVPAQLALIGLGFYYVKHVGISDVSVGPSTSPHEYHYQSRTAFVTLAVIIGLILFDEQIIQNVFTFLLSLVFGIVSVIVRCVAYAATLVRETTVATVELLPPISSTQTSQILLCTAGYLIYVTSIRPPSSKGYQDDSTSSLMITFLAVAGLLLLINKSRATM